MYKNRLLLNLTVDDLNARLDYYDCIGGEFDVDVFELAKSYYPRLWDKSRIDALLAAGKLTEEEYSEIVGDDE